MRIKAYNSKEGMTKKPVMRAKNSELFEARASLKLSMEKVAEEIGICAKTLFDAENLVEYPSSPVQAKICSYYSLRGIEMSTSEVFPEWLRAFRPVEIVDKKTILPARMVSMDYADYNGMLAHCDVLEEVERNLLRERVMQAVEMLPARRAAIAEYRYGLNGYEPHSLEDTGKMFRVSRQRVSQIEKKILCTLGKKNRLGNLKGQY